MSESATIIERFLSIAEDPCTSVKGSQEQLGKKVIGCFPMYIPEEIIHAAGMLPVLLWESNEPITVGNAHLPAYNCAICRSIVDDVVKGNLDFMDGMVFPDGCQQVRGLHFIVQMNSHLSYLGWIHMPPNLLSGTSKPMLMENLARFKAQMEEFSGQKITDESLNQSIQVFNRNRQLLRELYNLRRKNPGLLKAKEIVAIVQASMLMPKEEHSELLEKLLGELEKKDIVSDNKVKVILSGHLCAAPHFDILDLLDEQGGVVVDDDLYVGSRYFINDTEIGKDPLEAIADRWLKRTPPDSTKIDWESKWDDYIKEMAIKNEAKGVITLLVKFCPPHTHYNVEIKRTLAEVGIPSLTLETEHEAVSIGPLKSRIEAFIEQIKPA